MKTKLGVVETLSQNEVCFEAINNVYINLLQRYHRCPVSPRYGCIV